MGAKSGGFGGDAGGRPAELDGVPNRANSAGIDNHISMRGMGMVHGIRHREDRPGRDTDGHKALGQGLPVMGGQGPF